MVIPVKNRKMNITIELCIFKLVYVPNFSLNLQFSFFGPNLPKKDISSLKQKKKTLPLRSVHSNESRYQISAQTDNFDFFDPNLPKKSISGLKQKNRTFACVYGRYLLY